MHFRYTMVPVSDLRVEMGLDSNGKEKPIAVFVEGERLLPSDRFWYSIMSRFGITKAIFKYFDYPEVFDRIHDREANDCLRVCIEYGPHGDQLLAVSNPKKPIVPYEEIVGLLRRYHGEEITYDNGIVESIHHPRFAANRFSVNGDLFENRFMMTTPIDGYGTPSFYLSLLRTVCVNGVIGYSKVFKSSLALGKANDEVGESITRALDGFGNDEGYACLRQRIEAAGKSWASVYESMELYKLLTKLHSKSLLSSTIGSSPHTVYTNGLLANRDGTFDAVGSPIITAFHRLTGDMSHHYGLANLDALSEKKQRTLPVKCSVYDMINFVTEVSSHYSEACARRVLQAFVGDLLAAEYDMEGTMERYPDFSDFLIDSKLAVGLSGSANSNSTFAALAS